MRNETVFQFSTADFLMQGNYIGNYSIQDLLTQGNFGIGTFNALDGEMILLANKVFKADYEGKLTLVSTNEETPFAINTFFNPQKKIVLETKNHQETIEEIEKKIEVSESIFAIKIEGIFDFIKLRSGMKQSEPFPDFTSIIQKSNYFEATYLAGTMVGFYFPDSYEKISTSGFHFHFIDQKQNLGGHVCDFLIHKAEISIEQKTNLNLLFPKPSG